MAVSLKPVLLGGGIFMFFFLFGVIQEKIVKTKYVNSDGSVEYFNYSMSLVFIYCAVNYLLSSILIKFLKEEDSTPTLYFCTAAALYSLAMMCSNLALQFLSYPTQVVAKSCKPIAVMIFNILLGKRSYSFKKFIFVGIVISGIIMFMYKNKKEDKGKSIGFGIGELLVLSALFMDGMIAATQERMRVDHQTKSLSMMSQLNKWASIYVGVLWIVTQEVFKFTSFLQRQPSVIWKLGGLSICGFFGQFAMILTVVELGTLPASMIATTRKFFTVLASVLILGNPLLARQWVATLIIFTGLFLDILYGKSETKVK